MKFTVIMLTVLSEELPEVLAALSAQPVMAGLCALSVLAGAGRVVITVAVVVVKYQIHPQNKV